MRASSSRVWYCESQRVDSQWTQIRSWICLLTALLTLCGCSARPKVQEPVEMELSGMLIRGDGAVKSAKDLFEEGVGAFEGQQFEKCETLLQTYLEHFSSEVYTHAVHYNLGLCLELQRKHEGAVDHFRAYAELSQEASDRRDGEVRLGYNLIFAGRHQEAIELYTQLLTLAPIKGLDRAECHLRRAIAQSSIGKYAEADQDLGLAMSHTNSTLGPYRAGNEMLAEIYFQRGEVYRHHMGVIDLKLPLTKMRRNLSDKKRFFNRSLYAFIEAVKVAHSYWSIAAGHQLGVLYEDFYEDIMQAEYPEDFDEETVAFYYFKLEKGMTPILRQAISLYEKTITISSTQGAENEWVRSTQESLKRLRELEERLHHRLSMDEVEAHKLRTSQPLRRPPKHTLPLPPRQTGASDEHIQPVSTSTDLNSRAAERSPQSDAD